ncbi:MAG: response regulator [Candidatus Hydrogenedentes bacterium]|nr:response regulator [Candidatus Hydrogenedentota bacterium]
MNTSYTKHTVRMMGALPTPTRLFIQAFRALSDPPEDGPDLKALLLSYPATAVRLLQGIDLAQLSGARVDALLKALDPCHSYGVLLRSLPLPDHSPDDEAALETIWKQSYATALVAARLGELSKRVGPTQAYLAGLLHDVGRLVCWTLKERPLNELTSEVIGEAPNPERSLLGKWFVECAGLPEPIQDAVWLHHVPAETLPASSFPLDLIRLTALASRLGEALASGAPAWDPDVLGSCAGFLACDAGLLKEPLAHARAEFSRVFRHAAPPQPDAEESDWLSQGTQRLYAAIDKELHRVPVLSSRLGRMESVHQSVSAFAGREPLEDLVNTCAETVRTALRVAPGVCLAIDDASACLIGCSWRTLEAPLAPLRVDLHGEAETPEDATPVTRIVRDLAIGKIEASWYPHERGTGKSRDGLLILPLACGGRSYGQIIVDTSASGFGARSHDHTDALAIAQAFASILAQRSHMDHLSIRLERLIESAPGPAPSQPPEREASPRETPAAPQPPPAPDDTLGRVAGTIVKALEGPIGLISSQAQQLLIHTRDVATHRALDCIVKESRRLNRFMSDLLALAPHPRPQFETALINYRLQRFIGAMKQRLEKRGIVLHELYAEGLPRVLLDPRRMEHVFSNVLAHAEACIGEVGGHLTIQTDTAPDRATVRIRFVYDATGSAHSGRRDLNVSHLLNEPAALGLGACRVIMREHGGSIAMEDLPGGKEACVIALQSTATPHEAGGAVDAFSTLHANADPARVLVVDDDVAVREILKQTLHMRGFSVDLASDGVQAWTLIRQRPPDIILLDLLMPNRDGLSVLRELQQLTDPPPVIFMTGNASPQVREDALALGVRAFLLKPFELRRVLEEVDGILAYQS